MAQKVDINNTISTGSAILAQPFLHLVSVASDAYMCGCILILIVMFVCLCLFVLFLFISVCYRQGE